VCKAVPETVAFASVACHSSTEKGLDEMRYMYYKHQKKAETLQKLQIKPVLLVLYADENKFIPHQINVTL